jgi:cobalt-zinc-cadmium efflux system outer membrane protein
MQPQSLSRVTGRVLWKHKAGYVFALLVLSTGCATFDPKAGFPEMSASVEERSGMQVVWNAGTELDAQVAQKVRALLADKLTSDAAVQVALLNNRELQATYAEMGVAQADLVQAGLLKNPIFDIGVLFPLSGGVAKLELLTAIDFLHILYMPLRKRVAAARFADAKLQVTGGVLDSAATVRAAFYRHQANEQMLELLQSIAQGLALSLDVAQRLHEAGNITDLDLARERALAEEAKLRLRAAEIAVRQSREQLNILMGLWGKSTAWEIDRRLPDIPEQPISLEGLESQALRQSIDLASARQRIIVAGEQLGFSRATALVPELALGASAERESGPEGGSWEVGPVVAFEIPLFDQGQARIGRSSAELRRTQQEYYALGVRIRSTVRAVREGVRGAQDRAVYYRDILLPLRERIVNDTQLQYNAMQLGVFDLLQARERQIQAGVGYIEALRDYWLARTKLGQILSGRLPVPERIQTGPMERPTNMVERNQH